MKQSHKSIKALQKKAQLNASNEAAKEIFQKSDIQALQAELNELRQQLSKAKDAAHVQNQCLFKFNYVLYTGDFNCKETSKEKQRPGRILCIRK